MTKKPKVEWRVTCAQFGTAGHSNHSWIKKDEKKARQSVIDANHHAEMLMNKGTKSWYLNEAPYVLERREVGPWTEVTEDE